MSVGWNASLHMISSFFFSQVPRRERLDGHTSTTNINVDEAHKTVCPKMAHLLSVGHKLYWVLVLCASLSAFQVFFYRWLTNNALTGTIPAQISTSTKLTALYAQKWHIHWVLVICFNECWSCAPLSQPFKGSTSFYSWPFLQGPILKWLDWHHSQSNFNAHQSRLLRLFLRTVCFVVS